MKSIDWKLGMMKRPSHRSANLNFKDKFLLLPLVIMLPICSFEGVLRYYLALSGLELLIYIPKIMMIVSFSLAIADDLVRNRVSKGLWLLLLLLLVNCVVCWVYTRNIMQAAFSFWTMIPLLYGCEVFPALIKIKQNGRMLIFVLWAFSVFSVLLQYFVTFPWIDFNYSLLGMKMQGSKIGSYLGFSRYSGLGIDSFNTSYLIIFFTIYLLVTIKNKKYSIGVWLSSFIAIAMTLAKATILAYFIVCIVLLFINNRWFHKVINGMVAIVIAFGIIFPIISKFITLNLDSYLYQFMFLGFNDRIIKSWPLNLDRLFRYSGWFFGLGAGGVTGGLSHFDPERYIPVDNMYLYLYCCFGVGMFLLLWFIVKAMLTLSKERNWQGTFLWLLGFAILLIGISQDMVSSFLPGFIIGCIFRYGVGDVKLPYPIRSSTCLARSKAPLQKFGFLSNSSRLGGAETS